MKLFAVYFALILSFLHLMEFRAATAPEAHDGQDLVLVVVKVIQGSENRCLDDMADITAHFTDRLVSTFTKGWEKFHFQIRGKHFQSSSVYQRTLKDTWSLKILSSFSEKEM